MREFVKRHLPADIRRKVELGLRLEHEDYVTWYRILEARGWITPGWPVEHGGPGWNHVQRYIFDEETLLGGAPRIIASGIQMLGPVLQRIRHGRAEGASTCPTSAQSNTWWAQGFSEPGAGSDLAACAPRPCSSPTASTSLSTATRSGPRTRTGAHDVRARAHRPGRAKPQEGISFLLIDMDSPGMTCARSGCSTAAPTSTSVFLDNVRVPGKTWSAN